MNTDLRTTPVILLDRKKNRIRIHRQTLHLLGDPQYVVFLVNPKQRTIALCKSFKEDKLAHRINWQHLSDHACCEVYSQGLLYALQEICPELEPDSSYRIYGHMVPRYGVARFKVADMISMDTIGSDMPEAKYG